MYIYGHLCIYIILTHTHTTNICYKRPSWLIWKSYNEKWPYAFLKICLPLYFMDYKEKWPYAFFLNLSSLVLHEFVIKSMWKYLFGIVHPKKSERKHLIIMVRYMKDDCRGLLHYSGHLKGNFQQSATNKVASISFKKTLSARDRWGVVPNECGEN